jgi:aminopeptidase-like protein
MFWVLNFSDGHHTLLDIADRSGFSFDVISEVANALREKGLLKVCQE